MPDPGPNPLATPERMAELAAIYGGPLTDEARRLCCRDCGRHVDGEECWPIADPAGGPVEGWFCDDCGADGFHTEAKDDG